MAHTFILPNNNKTQTAGVTRTHKVPVKGSKKSMHTAAAAGSTGGTPTSSNGTDDAECYTCRANLYISWIHCDDDEAIYCLQHGLKHINVGRLKPAACRMLYAYSMQDVEQLMERVRCRSSQAGSATNNIVSPSAATRSIEATVAVVAPATKSTAAAAASAATTSTTAKSRKNASGRGR